ncbi:serine/threonine-protein kinase [Catenulispora subtropica]|uniref:serine/threonine-protein kinase n=1 Tax=Catenulispora subtropica TaxID=450798 RepID=UPI0031E1F2DD
MIDADDRIGRLVGDRYRLVERLGAGGFGHVWRAHDETLRIDVAVKEVRLPQVLTRREHAERLERAEREARHAARLRGHPNVVAVHDVVIQDGVPWTVMQLIPGRSLEARLAERGPLTPSDAALVARALLKALQAAHAAGIVHRDVKPGNVMLTPKREVILTDFGLAVAQADTSLTATGSVMGSMEYLAPERAEGRDGLPASDLFSLGATLYQAVEGISPFRRETATATLKAVLLDEPPPPRHAGPLAPLIAGLLVKDPGRRLGIDQALAVLDAPPAAPGTASGSGPIPSSASTVAAAPTQHVPSVRSRRMPGDPWRRAMPWILAAAGLIVAVVVAACTRQTVHSYHNPLRTLNKQAPTVLPGMLIATVASWALAAGTAARFRAASYTFGALALLLSVVGAAAYDRKTANFNQVLAREARGPWTEAHAAAVAWLLPVFAIIYLIVYWNLDSAGRGRGMEVASPRRAARR